MVTVTVLIEKCQLGCSMSLKINFLHPNQKFFFPSCGAVRNKHKKRFYQDNSVVGHRYWGRWIKAVLADYWWSMCKDAPELPYKRQTSPKKLMKPHGFLYIEPFANYSSIN